VTDASTGRSGTFSWAHETAGHNSLPAASTHNSNFHTRSKLRALEVGIFDTFNMQMVSNEGLFGKVQTWWHLNQLTFIFPPMYRAHEHKWHRISGDCVGCMLCGVVHICGVKNNIVPCNVELQDDSSMVCMYTGIVVKTTTLYDAQTSIAEYNADHMQMSLSCNTRLCKKRVDVTQKNEILHKITSDVIDLLFFSKQAEAARQFELTRYNRKIKKSFADFMSKSKNDFMHNNILNAVEHSMFAMRTFRKPVLTEEIPPKQHFTSIQNAIIMLLSQLQVPRPYVISEKNEKIKNLVTSLVYVCSDGISCADIVYLPKMPILKRILPLELVLTKCFNIQPKIVTDGENIIKMCIKNTRVPLQLQFASPTCFFETNHQCSCPHYAGL